MPFLSMISDTFSLKDSYCCCSTFLSKCTDLMFLFDPRSLVKCFSNGWKMYRFEWIKRNVQEAVTLDVLTRTYRCHKQMMEQILPILKVFVPFFFWVKLGS